MANTFDTQGVQISLEDSNNEYYHSRSPDEHQIQDLDPSTTSISPSTSPPSKHPSRSRAKRSRKFAHVHQATESKPKLRPAKDILSRIRHDPSLDIDNYVVGYHDRHLPQVQEMDVAMWKGGGDVTDEEFIPGHRIAWFRLKGKGDHKIWDRRERLDRLFGSGVPGNEVKNGIDVASDIDSPDDDEERTQVQQVVADFAEEPSK